MHQPTATDTVYLTPAYVWRCPACSCVNIERYVPRDPGDVPAVVLAYLRRRWQLPDGAPIPGDKLYTWPREVVCGRAGCRLEFLSHAGELDLDRIEGN